MGRKMRSDFKSAMSNKKKTHNELLYNLHVTS